MPIPSVRELARAVLLSSSLFFPLLAQSQIQGKWECTSKSGNFDPNTHYSMRCEGVLHFKSDRILESSCSDGFFPSGVYWEAKDQTLTLRDSAGKAFADFNILEASKEKLLLSRKEVQYAFRRIGSASNSISER